MVEGLENILQSGRILTEVSTQTQHPTLQIYDIIVTPFDYTICLSDIMTTDMANWLQVTMNFMILTNWTLLSNYPSKLYVK